MKLDELNVYNLSMELGEKVWELICTWDWFSKDTIGKQLIRSVDSVAANISEGFGRYHFGESKHFNYYARGSLYETKTWLCKANNRRLINDVGYFNFIDDINNLGVKLNNYINSIGKTKTHKTTE
jgi:four helix bundle protein